MLKPVTLLNKYKSHLVNVRQGKPSDHIKVIGVTGSFGKTIVTHLLKDILNNSGQKAGFLSSVGYSVDGENYQEDVNANFLDVGDVHKLLKKMAQNELDFAVIELTAKNAEQNKYEGLNLDSAIITNINNVPKIPFKSWEDYALSKLSVVDLLRDSGFIVIGDEDPSTTNWLRSKGETIEKEIYANWVNKSHFDRIDFTNNGLNLSIHGYDLDLGFLGEYNVMNTLLALKLAEKYLPLEQIIGSFPMVKMPSGRMEIVEDSPVKIIIDYSYTPNMLEASLSHLFNTKNPESRIITVFGCAGERDPSRRKMGKVAAKYSNIIMLAAEDPKGEKVRDINTEIYHYAEAFGGVLMERFESNEEYLSTDFLNLMSKIDFIISHSDVPVFAFDANHYSSRLDAIDFAIKCARPGDIVYITGKGNETSLAFNNIEYEWSDHLAVKEILSNKETSQELSV
jgi:UDP-N-acetylmuramoyl-L-alanyl-D-glutamate--2,6-diaminopimelate ligase